MKGLLRIYAIGSKEFRLLRRDKLTFAMIAGIPLGLLLLFGYAINQDVRHLSAGVVDHSVDDPGQPAVLRYTLPDPDADHHRGCLPGRGRSDDKAQRLAAGRLAVAASCQ